MPVCKNCGGSNKKVILNYTPKAYTICPDPGTCSESYDCSEILDAACVQYTDNNIIYCNSSFIAINKFDSIEEAFQKLLDLICQTPPRCALKVNIVPNSNEATTPTLTASVTNGVGPYTYKWEIAQGIFKGHLISGSTTTQNLNLICIASNTIRTGSIDKNIKISNIKLTVTDSEGCRQTVHFVYTSDCYSQPVTPSQPRQAFLGGRLTNTNGLDSKFALVPMDFTDNPAYMPTCPELKNICCNECYVDSEEAAAEFRESRDRYIKYLNENILNEFVGAPKPNIYLDYSQWLPGGLGDKTVFHKGGLVNYNMLLGCPECTYKLWTEIPWPALGGQTLAQRFPTININTGTKFYWIDAVDIGDTPPIGQPGQLLNWATNPLNPTYYGEYAWDPATNTWSLTLGGILGDIANTDRSRRDAWVKAFNELILANSPFLWANDYALLHRFKYELKYPL